MDKVLVIYHRDNDGYASCASVLRKYPDAEIFDTNYGESFPYDKIKDFTKKDKIFIVDFSYPYEKMLKIADKVDLIWIDHHIKSIDHEKKYIQKYQDSKRIFGVRQDGTAGCVLTWNYLFNHDKEVKASRVPKVIELAGKYDIWDHEDPDVLGFYYGSLLYDIRPGNHTMWNQLFTQPGFVKQLIEKGKIIQKVVEQEYKIYVSSYGWKTRFHDQDCLVINRGGVDGHAFSLASQGRDCKLLASYARSCKGDYKVSLRTDFEDVDCNAIASEYGGGGHRAAAGFRCEDLFFEDGTMVICEEGFTAENLFT
jgi:oligoribonuclease NrnB/cAMP/cGMP phosphodiesterase (DHH superfamily)